MSIPFLCRYAKMTGDAKYLDDAANQVLMFKKYLYMPEYKIMSHVYDFMWKRPHRYRGEEAMDGRCFPYRSCWNICLRTIKTEAVSWNSLQAFVRDTWPCREAEDCGIRC